MGRDKVIIAKQKQIIEAYKNEPDDGQNEYDYYLWDKYLGELYKELSALENEVQEQPVEMPMEIIEFATWYSGMDKQKVVNAYNRFLREVKKRDQITNKG